MTNHSFKKLYLPADSKQDFLNYLKDFCAGYNIKQIDKKLAENYFDLCAKGETYTNIMGKTVILGQVYSTGEISMICYPSGETITDPAEIQRRQRAEYEADPYGFVCRSLHHEMTCELERIVRVMSSGSDDWGYNDKKIWNKINL